VAGTSAGSKTLIKPSRLRSYTPFPLFPLLRFNEAVPLEEIVNIMLFLPVTIALVGMIAGQSHVAAQAPLSVALNDTAGMFLSMLAFGVGDIVINWRVSECFVLGCSVRSHLFAHSDLPISLPQFARTVPSQCHRNPQNGAQPVVGLPRLSG
jgi:hypothetical protein